MRCYNCNNFLLEGEVVCNFCDSPLNVYQPPEGYVYDPGSGLFYSSEVGADPETGAPVQWVTWFNAQSGEHARAAYPIKQENNLEPAIHAKPENKSPADMKIEPVKQTQYIEKPPIAQPQTTVNKTNKVIIIAVVLIIIASVVMFMGGFITFWLIGGMSTFNEVESVQVIEHEQTENKKIIETASSIPVRIYKTQLYFNDCEFVIESEYEVIHKYINYTDKSFILNLPLIMER